MTLLIFLYIIQKKFVFLHPMKRLCQYTLIALSFIALCSCNGYDKMLKSTDYSAKYDAALRYYNEGRYTRARQLFENLTLYDRSNEHSEDIAWYYGQSLLKSEYYYLGSYQFKMFTKRFPYSSRAEEAAFLSAYCQYMDSPSHTLDQSTTKDAITELKILTKSHHRAQLSAMSWSPSTPISA